MLTDRYVQGGSLRAWTRLASLLIGLSQLPVARAAAPLPALPAIDDKWRHFTSPHFELYSRNAEKPSREVLHNLELLRAVFLDRMKLEERLHVPVTVYYFRTKKDFQAYAPKIFENQDSLAGFHLFQADRAIISLAPAEDDDAAQQTIFHEYVHHLFRVTERHPPLWYNEGTAEVLAGVRLDRDRVAIGTPLDSHVIYLRTESLLPLDQLFAANQSSGIYTKEEHTGVFYAESWALLHYWNFGDARFSKDAVHRFLVVAGDSDLAAKADLPALFKQCFGCDYTEMLRQLRNYIHTGSYHRGSYPMPKLDEAASYAVRPVALDEITVRLAELAVRVRQSGVGELVLLNAMKARPDDPRSFETLGAEALLEHDERTVNERWEQALAAGSKNPAILRELALMEGRQWFGEFNESFQPPTELVTRVRSRLLRSIAAEPTQGAAYEMLAWVEAFAEIPDAKNINLIIAHLPEMAQKQKVLIGLTRIMLRLGKGDVAKMMLDRLDTLTLDAVETRASTVLHARLETDFPGLARTAANDDAETIKPPPTFHGVKRPSVPVPEEL